MHVQFGTRFQVAHPHAGYPFALAEEPDDAGAVRHRGPVVGRGAGHRHGVPGVVDLGVVVLGVPLTVVSPGPNGDDQGW